MKRPPEGTAITNASRELLQQGDAVGAEQILSPLISALRSDPEALHLMGLIKRAQNDLGEAERYFRSAVAYSLNEGGYYNDLGVVLAARGEYTEALRVYRAALALTPQAMSVRVNIVRALMDSGDLIEAEREARIYVATVPSAEAWTLLGQVQRALDRNDEAVASAAAALKYAPRMRGLQLNHATALDRAGRAKEALAIYERLAKQELDTGDLALNYARALYAEGKKIEAEEVLQQGVERFAGSVALHSALSRMRFLRGEKEASVASFEQAIAARPKDLALRLGCADALHRAHHTAKACNVLEEALRQAPDSPALLTAFGIVLDELDRPRDGLAVLRKVAALTPDSGTVHRNMLSTLIRAGMADEALRVARALREQQPEEQYLIACEALALRVMGDPEYRTICDYDRLVRTYEVTPPRGFFTAENFNAALADVLRYQHKTNAHPLDQHLPHGSQTGRSLLALGEPNITAFMGAVDFLVRDYVSHLDPTAGDPASKRRNDRFRYSSLWSVRSGDQGYQPNHVHDHGWISSAYFVALTPNESMRDSHAGWLKLGEPNRPVAGCGPERWIEPKMGTLVLFPSYLWHGTAPFEGAERLSLAFDVAPG